MVHDFKTEQEAFWAGEFGDKYISRNSEKELLAAKISLWSKILQKGKTIENCLEFGPNIGMNLKALGILFPHMDMYGVEINKNAAEECGKLERTTVYNESILEFSSEKMLKSMSSAAGSMSCSLMNFFAQLMRKSSRPQSNMTRG